MARQNTSCSSFRKSGNLLPFSLFFCLLPSLMVGCSEFAHSDNSQTVDSQTVDSQTDAAISASPTDEEVIQNANQPYRPAKVIGADISNGQCAIPFANEYSRSIAFASFPRSIPATSSAGVLHEVDQHLPMLLSANLRTRHSTLTPIQMTEGFHSANYDGELRAATQAQLLARKHRVQFIVSGEVQDMSMTFPDRAYAQGAVTRLANGTYNVLRPRSWLHTKSRAFNFNVQLRDGFTGQVLFERNYATLGKWDATQPATIGFGSPRFWTTDYGKKIQRTVAKASDELAAVVSCRPYIARVDMRPGRQQIIIHSGTNNGLRTGDALELYQLVLHPVTGEYNQFDTQMINRNTLVYLTEVYPSHSVANIGHDVQLNGQYLAMAP